MIDQDQPERGGGSVQIPRGLVIFRRGVRLARGMVVSEHDRRGGGTQGSLEHTPDVHRGLRGSAFADHLLFEQVILPIEKESYDDLVSSPGEPRLEVGGNCGRRVERTGSRRIGPETFPQLERGLDLRDLGDIETSHLEEVADVGPIDPVQATKVAQKRSGKGEGCLPRNAGLERSAPNPKDDGQELGIRKPLWTFGDESLPRALW